MFLRIQILLLLLVTASGQGGLWAQLTGFGSGVGSSDDLPKFKVEGTVINAVTGEPLSRAVVRLEALGVPRAVFTSLNGRFEFSAVPQGSAVLTPRKPGYMVSERETQFSYRIAVDASTGPVTLRLLPQAVITGHVEDSNGAPIESAGIKLWRITVRDGRQRREQVAGLRTDEDGNYRVAGLFPGRYFIAVQAQNNLLAMTSTAKAKMGYPAAVYYPSASSLSSATPVQLSAGQVSQADFVVGMEPVFTLSGTVSGYGPGQIAGIHITDLAGEQIFPLTQFNQRTGSFEFRMVGEGTYNIFASTARNQDKSQDFLTAETKVNVSGNIKDIHLALQPGITIPVAIRFESTQQQPERHGTSVRLIFHPRDANSQSPIQAQDIYPTLEPGDGPDRFLLHNIPPGKYSVEVHALKGYVRSVLYGVTDLFRDEVVITRSTSILPLEIVMRDDVATLSVTIHSNDANLNGANLNGVLLLVPDGAPMQPPRVNYAYGMGVSSFNGLAPGDYRVFAFDSAAGIEYTNPEALAPYAADAVTVHLAPYDQARVQAEIVHTTE
ncbi:MAG TPA: carboxypeptidase-like regulatory domain-containing protein [Candidatus Angelobacter sp.]|nr:carboxypeptidase-like regulatory domain-containing protein [Candidatus Angelobacter sp.]